jgi:hypothetical protein
VIVTEAIGYVPMSAPIYDLLASYDGREASISGITRPRWGVERPEIVVPLPAEETPSGQNVEAGQPLEIGSHVRVIRGPELGATGTVMALPSHGRRLETGGRVQVAEVDVGRELPLSVPLLNLETLC